MLCDYPSFTEFWESSIDSFVLSAYIIVVQHQITMNGVSQGGHGKIWSRTLGKRKTSLRAQPGLLIYHAMAKVARGRLHIPTLPRSFFPLSLRDATV